MTKETAKCAPKLIRDKQWLQPYTCYTLVLNITELCNFQDTIFCLFFSEPWEHRQTMGKSVFDLACAYLFGRAKNDTRRYDETWDAPLSVSDTNILTFGTVVFCSYVNLHKYLDYIIRSQKHFYSFRTAPTSKQNRMRSKQSKRRLWRENIEFNEDLTTALFWTRIMYISAFEYRWKKCLNYFMTFHW